jgi:chemotaxis protein CheD
VRHGLAGSDPVRNTTAAQATFDHIHRSRDRATGRWCARLLPGEYVVVTDDELVTTVLGSCVSACVRDPVLALGGMNHFMLPEDTTQGSSSWLNSASGLAHRYGSYAMESLINDLLKLGAHRNRLEVKLVGGGRILASMTDIGSRNVEFVRKWLATEGLPIAGEDVGGECPRRVLYEPATGRVSVTRLRRVRQRDVAKTERSYYSQLRNTSAENDVELFA